MARSPACIARCTSPTIRCTTKSLLTPGDLGFRSFETKFGRIACWCVGTSGIRKARAWLRSPAHRCCFIRPPSAGTRAKTGARRFAARCVANDPAQPCDRERRVCRGGESRGIRGRSSQGHRILGIVVHLRSIRACDRRGFEGPGGNPDRRVRPPPPGAHSQPLAVSARPPHRCLWSNPEPMAGLRAPTGGPGGPPRTRGPPHICACRPSGSPTKPLGSRGRMSEPIGPGSSRQFHGSTAKLCGDWRASSACGFWWTMPTPSSARPRFFARHMPTSQRLISSISPPIGAGCATRRLCSCAMDPAR